MPGAFDDLIPTATEESPAGVNPFSDLIPQSRESRQGTIQQQIDQTSIPAEEEERPLLERRATDALLAQKQLGNVLDAAAVQAARVRERQSEQAQADLRTFESQWPRETPDPTGLLTRRRETLLSAANAANAEVVRSRKYIEDAARGITGRAPAVAALAESQSDFQKRFNEAQGKEAWKLFLQRPAEVLAGTITSSSVISAPALGLGVVGGVGGPVGSAAGVAEGSFLVEFGNTVSQEMETELRKRGKKPDDMDAVTALLADNEFLDRSRAKATARGVPIAIFDALTAGLAGKFLGPALGKGKLRVAIGAAKETGMQMAGGALGEAAGELAAGEKLNPKDILLEAVAELPGGVRETVQNVYHERAKGKTDVTTTGKADEVLDGGATPARVPADGQDRAGDAAGQSARPANSFSDLIPSPVPVVPVPEAAPGAVAPEPPKPQRVDVPGVGAVNIQNPAGSIRAGKDKGGNEWQVTMPAHYGDIVGTKGKDKDRIDIYVGPNIQTPGPVAIVNQINPETGKFDEHKVLAGFASLDDAVAAYDAAFSDGSGPARRQSVETFSPEQFQTWLKEGDHSKPAGGQKIQLGALPAPVEEPPAPPVTQPTPQGPPPPKKPTTTSAPPADSLFRETSAQEIDSYVNPATSASVPFGVPEVYASTTRDLALGQGRNKTGIVVEFDSAKLDVTTPKTQKPGAAFVEQQGGGAERIIRGQASMLRPAVRSVTIPNAKSRDPHVMRLRRYLADNWDAEKVGESTVYRPRAAEPKPTVPETIPPAAETKAPVAETISPPAVPAKPDISKPAIRIGTVTDAAGNPVKVHRPPTLAKPAPEAAAVETPKPAKAGLTEAENARLKELQEKLRKKFGATYTGIDPEIITIGGEMASLYIRSGVRKFAAFARDVKNDLPEIWDKLKAHLRSIWEAAAVTNDGLDEPTRSEAKAVVEALDAETVKEPLPKEEGVKPPEVNQPTKKEGDGSLRTGVLMGAAFNPALGAGTTRTPVVSSDDFVNRVQQRRPMTAGAVKITGNEVRLPSGAVTKSIWGDRQFSKFFLNDPVERAGEFRGNLDAGYVRSFFEFLKSKGASVFETEEGKSESIKFTDIANKIADSLENLKGTRRPGELQLFGLAEEVWNTAINLAQGVIRAGGKVADAVAKAIAYIRANHKGDWDEAGARAALETASAGPSATEQGVIEPAEGEQPPVVDEHWVETKVKGVSWWVRDRDRLTPESAARSIAAAEAAFTEAGFESERRTMFDQGDHQTKSILFIPETENADAKGRKLAEVLEREIATQREEGKGADHVSTLINSVREGFDQPESAFRQMSQQVRNRLFALAQEEASWRGRALRALANSKADIIRVSRNVDVYLQRIYSKAFSDDPTSETANELHDALREVLSEEEIQKLKDLIQDPAHRDRIKAALKRALAKVGAKGNRRFGRKNWRTIESLIEGGILDDTEWFKELARKRGWKVPTDAEIEQMRRLADEEQALRKPTDAELAKAGDDPQARERLLADIEAATRESRFKLQKRLAVMWSEMTKPVSMRHYWTQRQNNARFLNELMTANLLFRASFVTKQAIDVSTQWFWRMPMRAVAQALTLRKNDLAKGQQVQFWDDAQAALKDIYGDSIKSLKVAGSKARAALAGRVEIRNVDRLMGSVSALDRLWLRADRAAEAGNNAEAFMWRAVAAIGYSYKVAGAFDYLHGTPAEWNERRFRVIEALRETGVDAATARVQAEWVMDKTLAEYPEAVAMTRSMLEARGIPFTEQQLGEDAWNMVERRQYQRINELGLPMDAIQEQADLYRNTLGWNEREMRGPGGLAGAIVQGVGAIGEGIGLPLAMGRFGNAIAIGINRQLHKTPLYALADIRLPFLRGGQAPSPWSRTMTDIYERRLEAVAGTMLGSTMLALAAGGLLKVWLKPPPDKEERELWEREGHKAGTVEIPLGDGRYSVWSLTAGPFALVAPYLAAGGAINDLTVKREKQQAKLNADAARRGLTPAKLPAPDISDWLGVAAQAAQASILGNRTASGLFYSVTDYGTPNVKKFLAAQFTPLVPGLPALQEVSRMSGVIIDPKKADIIDFLLPLPTSKARKYNMLGDPVGTPDDVQRVIQTLTGGSYPVITPGAARETDAYQTLFATGYRPPSIDPNAGHAIGGDLRPFTSSELERYTEARSRNLRQELSALGAAADPKAARAAYQRANDAALREVGVTVAPRAETSAGGRAASGARASGSSVGGLTARTPGGLGGLSGGTRQRGIGRSRLSRGLRAGRLGRGRLSRATSLRQPSLSRGRRRGVSRIRRAA